MDGGCFSNLWVGEDFTGAHIDIYTEPTTKQQFLTIANYISIKLDIHMKEISMYIVTP